MSQPIKVPFDEYTSTLYPPLARLDSDEVVPFCVINVFQENVVELY